MRTFKQGKTYTTRSICDYNCIWSFKIHKRTAKSVWVDVRGKRVRRSVSIFDNTEYFKPFGNYSMACMVKAEREVAQ